MKPLKFFIFLTIVLVLFFLLKLSVNKSNQKIAKKGDIKSIYTFGDISFESDNTWQILSNQSNQETIGFFIKSLCINQEEKLIPENSEANCDVTIADYLPLEKQRSMTYLKQFVDFISNQGQDETMPTSFQQGFYNNKNILITKWTGAHPLSGEIIESYFLQYNDKSGQVHFVNIYGDPIRISKNDVNLKQFVQKILIDLTI